MVSFPRLVLIPSEMLKNQSEAFFNLTMDDINHVFHDINTLRRMYGFNITHPKTPAECDECKWAIQDIAVEYAEHYHGYVSIIVCGFGTIANMLNIVVLTRKDIACAPINRILTGLAVVDMVLMMEYMTYAYYYHIELPGEMSFPFAGALFILFHTHFSQILHTISICLTLTLAVWRYIAIG